MNKEERFDAIKKWYDRLDNNYELDKWATLDPMWFDELHKLIYHVDFTVEEEQS